MQDCACQSEKFPRTVSRTCRKYPRIANEVGWNILILVMLHDVDFWCISHLLDLLQNSYVENMTRHRQP